MRDYIDVGCSPCDEPCAQAGRDSVEQMRAECAALIHQLPRMYGPEPEGASLKIRQNSHDFGTYLDVVCYYDTNNPEATDYAFQCEDLPEHWDEEAKKELGLTST